MPSTVIFEDEAERIEVQSDIFASEARSNTYVML
jgi:hypothetical protein